jgi:ABC-type cobalt transport system substrate-binding protein
MDINWRQLVIIIPLLIILGQLVFFFNEKTQGVTPQITTEREASIHNIEYNYTHGFHPIFSFTSPPILFIVSSHVVVSRSAVITILLDEDQPNLKFDGEKPTLKNPALVSI